MAFGYMESDYTVERKVTIQTASGEQTIELRETIVPPRSKEEEAMWAEIFARMPPEQRQRECDKRMNRYIALEGKDCDLLLRYGLSQEEDLEADWVRLVNEPEVPVRDLLCEEYVEGHGFGWTKSGATIMY
jgi:hypothetical protein